MTLPIDTFIRDRLPPADQQPEFLFDLPELQYPETLNAAVELIDRQDPDAAALINDAGTWTYGAMKDLSDRIRQTKKATAVLLGSVDDGRAYLVVNVDPALVERGVDAVAVARAAATKIGGGGGGRPDLAEAGGKNPEGLPEAYEVGKREIASALR